MPTYKPHLLIKRKQHRTKKNLGNKKTKKRGGNPLLVAALASPVIGKLIDWIWGKGHIKKNKTN